VDEVEEARTNVFLDKLRITLKSGEFKRQDHLLELLLEEGFSSTDVASALLHHLQGDAAPAAKPPREEERPAPARAPYREEHDRRFRDRPRAGSGPREDARRDYRADRAPRPERREVRPSPRREFPTPVQIEKVVRVAKAGSLPPVAPAEPTQPHTTPAPVPSGEMPKRPLPFPDRHPPAEPAPAKPPKHRPPSPGDHTRLHINVGAEMGVGAGDVLSAILGQTGLPAKTVGLVDVREKHLFVDVASEHAHGIIAKLNRAQIKGRKVKVKAA